MFADRMNEWVPGEITLRQINQKNTVKKKKKPEKESFKVVLVLQSSGKRQELQKDH